MAENERKHKINNFALAAVIILLVTIFSIIYSGGTARRLRAEDDASVIFRNNNSIFVYSIEDGVYELKDYESDESKSVSCVAEKNGEYYFVDKKGNEFRLEIENILLETVSISYDKKYVAFLNEKRDLYRVNVSGDKPNTYSIIDNDVKHYSFTGRKNDIVFMKDDDSMFYFSGYYKNKEEENIKKFQVSNGMDIFYIRDGGTAVMFNVGKKTEFDENVNDIKFNDGLLFYIKENDENKKELCYFNGEESFYSNIEAESFLD